MPNSAEDGGVSTRSNATEARREGMIKHDLLLLLAPAARSLLPSPGMRGRLGCDRECVSGDVGIVDRKNGLSPIGPHRDSPESDPGPGPGSATVPGEGKAEP
eukprot:699069-Hanusia_phi.AAC.2